MTIGTHEEEIIKRQRLIEEFEKKQCKVKSWCSKHTPAPQRLMSSDVVVRVCLKCGRQYEPEKGRTYQN